MGSPYERLVELSRRLRAATDEGQIEWTAEDDTSFLWTGASGAISVRSRDGDGEEPFELDVFSAARQKVETLGSEWTTDEQPAPWNDALTGLYRSARRRALGVDRILEDLLGELPRVRDEAVSAPTSRRPEL
ncbi:MAG: hypothetical protein ACRDOP_04930 [Gaiellaceae bacterium]